MTTILFMLMCAAAEGFLLYVLVQFTRELRIDYAVRSAAVPVSGMAGEKTAERRKLGTVIEITDNRRRPKSQNSSSRKAS